MGGWWYHLIFQTRQYLAGGYHNVYTPTHLAHRQGSNVMWRRLMESAPGQVLCMNVAGHYWCRASDSCESADVLLFCDQFRFLIISSPALNLRCRLDISIDVATSLVQERCSVLWIPHKLVFPQTQRYVNILSTITEFSLYCDSSQCVPDIQNTKHKGNATSRLKSLRVNIGPPK